uniref:serine/threonine-protein kinase n=1 Tax=Tessaracoccus timonensis TaxID=2161816 RepID=UPI000D5621E4|nr:serine/threonine-protein kinase [Tessaracoccus timonensis]
MTTSNQHSIVPGYVLGPVIGKGGFATVYRARQESLDREVAIKIDQRVVDDSRNARRFFREATAASLISSHPHVVSLIDAGTTEDNRPYLVMELCDGGSVAKLVKKHGPLRPADVNELAIAITEALAAAHEHGILHRDLKPANIMIDSYGTPRLGDFGLAALPNPGDELSVTLEALTPAYASPETFERAVPSKAADIWSLGATFYTVLTGRAPRRNPDGSAMTVAEIIQHLDSPLPAPTHIPYAQPLMQAIWHATSHDPASRPTAAELRAQLVALRGRLGPGRDVQMHTDITQIAPELRTDVNSTAHMSTVPAEPTPRRNPWVWPIVAASLVAVLVVLAGIGLATNWIRIGGEETPGTQGKPPAEITWVAPAVGACFGELHEVDGGVVAEERRCEEQHHWQTFATGKLSDDAQSPAPEKVRESAEFKKACTTDALDEFTEVPLERLKIDVLPPSPEKFEAGERRFSCIATSGPRIGSLE